MRRSKLKGDDHLDWSDVRPYNSSDDEVDPSEAKSHITSAKIEISPININEVISSINLKRAPDKISPNIEKLLLQVGAGFSTENNAAINLINAFNRVNDNIKHYDKQSEKSPEQFPEDRFSRYSDAQLLQVSTCIINHKKMLSILSDEIEQVILQCSDVDDRDLITALRSEISKRLKELQTTEVQIVLSMKNRLLATQKKVLTGQTTLAQLSANNYDSAKAINLFREHIQDIYNDRANYKPRNKLEIERVFAELNQENNQLTPALNRLEASNNEFKLEYKTPAQVQTMDTAEYLNYLAQERLRNNYVIWHGISILSGNNRPTITLKSELKAHSNFFSNEKINDFTGLDAKGNIVWVESIRTWIEESQQEFKKLKASAPRTPNRALSNMQRSTEEQIKNSKDRFEAFKQNVADDLAEKSRKAIEDVLLSPGEHKEQDVQKLVKNLVKARLFINKARGKALDDYIADLDIMKILSEIISRRILNETYGNESFQRNLILLLNYFHPVARRVQQDFIVDRVIDLVVENFHKKLAPEHGETRINGILKYFLEPMGVLPSQTLLALTKSQLERIPQEKKPNPAFSLQALRNSNGKKISDIPVVLTKYCDGKNRNIVKAGGERERFLNDPKRADLINKVNILGRFIGFSAKEETIELERFRLDASIQSIDVLRKELETEIHQCEISLKDKGLLYRLQHANAYAMQKAWLEQLKTCLWHLNANQNDVIEKAFSEAAIKNFIKDERGYVDLSKVAKIKSYIQKYERIVVVAKDRIEVVNNAVSEAVIREFQNLLSSNISGEEIFDRWDGIVAFLIENNMGNTIKELIQKFDGKNSAVAELVLKENLNQLKFENNYNPILDYAEKRFNYVFNVDFNWDKNDDAFLRLHRDNEKFMAIFNNKAAEFIKLKRAQGLQSKDIKMEVFSLIGRFANTQNSLDYGVARIYQLLESPDDAKEQDVPELLGSLSQQLSDDLEKIIDKHIDDEPWTSVTNKIIENYGTLEQKQAWNSKWISLAMEADYGLNHPVGQDSRRTLLAKLTALNGDVSEYKKFFGESNLITLCEQLKEMTSTQKEMKPIILQQGTIINELYKYFVTNIPGELPDEAEIKGRLQRQELSTILVAGVASFAEDLSSGIQPVILASDMVFADQEDEKKNIDLYYSLYKIPLILLCNSRVTEMEAKVDREFLFVMKNTIQTIRDMPFNQVKFSYEVLVANLPTIPAGLKALASGRSSHNQNIPAIIAELKSIQLSGQCDKTKTAFQVITNYLTIVSEGGKLKKLLDEKLCMLALNEIKILLKKGSSPAGDKLAGLFAFYKKYIKDNYDVAGAMQGQVKDKLIKGIAIAEAVYLHFAQMLGEQNIDSIQLKQVIDPFKEELRMLHDKAIPSISKAPSASFSLQSRRSIEQAADRAQATRLDNLALDEIQRYINNGARTRVHQSREVFFKSYEQVEIKCEPNTYANRAEAAVQQIAPKPEEQRTIAREYALLEIYRIASKPWTDASEMELAALILEINNHYVANKSFYVNGESTKQRLLSLGNMLNQLQAPAEKILTAKRLAAAEGMSNNKGHVSPGAA